MGSGISRGDPNGPENKIHIKKVPFRSSEMIPVNVLEGSGMSGTPEGKGEGYMNVSLHIGMIASCTKCSCCSK